MNSIFYSIVAICISTLGCVSIIAIFCYKRDKLELNYKSRTDTDSLKHESLFEIKEKDR